VAQNMHDVGERSTQTLIARMEGTAKSDEPVSDLVKPALHVRKSTGG